MRVLLQALGAGISTLLALWAGCSSAQTTAAPAGAAGGAYTVKFVNGDSQGVTSIYASAPGKNDWGDDLLGKQSAAVGKTVTLVFRNIASDACERDLQMLMNDGKVVEKGRVDVCKTPEYRFKR